MDNGEYKRYLDAQFTDLKGEFRSLRDDVVTLKTEIAGLKVKSGVWGAALFGAAMIAVLLFEFVFQN